MSDTITREEFEKLKKQSDNTRQALITLIAAMDEQKPHSVPRPINTENAKGVLRGHS